MKVESVYSYPAASQPTYPVQGLRYAGSRGRICCIFDENNVFCEVSTRSPSSYCLQRKSICCCVYWLERFQQLKGTSKPFQGSCLLRWPGKVRTLLLQVDCLAAVMVTSKPDLRPLACSKWPSVVCACSQISY